MVDMLSVHRAPYFCITYTLITLAFDVGNSHLQWIIFHLFSEAWRNLKVNGKSCIRRLTGFGAAERMQIRKDRNIYHHVSSSFTTSSEFSFGNQRTEVCYHNATCLVVLVLAGFMYVNTPFLPLSR